jgi:hypothetical protein
MLLLEDVLICEVNLPVEVLKAGSLAEAMMMSFICSCRNKK